VIWTHPIFLEKQKRKEKRENTNTKNCLQIKQLYTPDPLEKFSPHRATDPSLKKKQTEACLTEEIDDEETLVQPIHTICREAIVT